MTAEGSPLIIPELLIGRDRELRVVEEAIRRALDDQGVATPQHLLVAGPHGDGKTALLAQARANVESDSVGDRIAFAATGRLVPHLSAPDRFLDDLTRQVEGDPPNKSLPSWTRGGERQWRTAMTRLHAALDNRFGEAKGLLVVMIERFEDFLPAVFHSKDEQSLFRTLLQKDARVMVIATAHTPDVQADYDERLFQIFRTVTVQSLSPDIADACFMRLKRGDRAGARSKLRSVIRFAGGRARRVWAAIERLQNDAVLPIDRLLDQMAEAEADRFTGLLNALSPRALQIFDALARSGDPASASDLAERLGAEQPQIARAFKELKQHQRLVWEAGKSGRKKLVAISDRLLAYWYQRRIVGLPAQSTRLAPATTLATALDLHQSSMRTRLKEYGLEHAPTAERFAKTKAFLESDPDTEEAAAMLTVLMVASQSPSDAADLAVLSEKAPIMLRRALTDLAPCLGNGDAAADPLVTAPPDLAILAELALTAAAS